VSRPPLIHEYENSWVDQFDQLKYLLTQALHDIDFCIEHVGSTSVVGLAAKPIIDIDLIYYTEKDFNLIKYRLIGIGYYHNGDQGIKTREVFKRTPDLAHDEHLDHDETLDLINHHLYVNPVDGPELSRHLIFRDYLRRHEAARDIYAAMKYQAAIDANQDRKRYQELKEIRSKKFVQDIIDMT